MVSKTDLDELEALFEEDSSNSDLVHQSADATPYVAEDASTQLLQSKSFTDDKSFKETAKESGAISEMEAEYQKLQEQMKLLEEKMNKKKLCSVTPADEETPLSQSAVPNLSNNSSDAYKRSFADAFGLKCEETDATKHLEGSNDLCKESSLKNKKYPSPVNSLPIHKTDNIASCEKKPRIARVAQNGNLHRQKILKQLDANKATTSLKGQAKLPSHSDIEQFSRIHLKQRYISKSEFKERMEGKLFLKLSCIRPSLSDLAERDWVTIAVVAKQLDPQTAKNGKKFSIWHLSDLDDCTKHVALFLFGKVHEELWRNVTVGTTIGLLNPSIMPPKKEEYSSGKSYDNTPALTVDVAERVMKIGISSDLGWCTATKYRNKQPAGKCLAFINKQFGDVCVFHMQSKYKKSCSKRGELQSTSAPRIPAKYKNTIWNKVKGEQFFYGGQTFSAAPPSSNPTIQRKDSKMKLTKILSNISASSSTEEEKDAKERSKVMQAVSGIEGNHVVSGCSDKFAEMLASGDMIAGSRQFLNHLHKKSQEKIEKAPEKSITSPSEFLNQQKKLIDSRKNSEKTPDTPKVLNALKADIQFTTVKDLKKSSEVLLQMKRDRYLQKKKNQNKSSSTASNPTHNSKVVQAQESTAAPRLACDVKTQKEVNLFGDWLTKKSSHVSTSKANVPSLAELRKRKAIAKLKDESGKIAVKKSDPNAVIGQIRDVTSNEKLQRKVQEKVDNNRKDLTAAKSVDSESVSLRAAVGKPGLSEKEFNEILNARSSHTDALDQEEAARQEEYFNPLIRKEMMEEKMADTFEVPSKVVTCQQCQYTFWSPHDRCKKLQHALTWRDVKKRFFQCTNCKQRTTIWEPYPTKSCRECGSEKKWKRTCMLKNKDGFKLDSEILLLRGVEHSKFLNSMR